MKAISPRFCLIAHKKPEIKQGKARTQLSINATKLTLPKYSMGG